MIKTDLLYANLPVVADAGRSEDRLTPVDAIQLLSIPEFCRRYGQSRSVVYELLGSGGRPPDLKGVKVGRRTFIPLDEAEKWRTSLPAFRPHHPDGADHD